MVIFMSNKPTVYIHTNDKQIVGAKVGTYSMRKASKHPDEFDVKLIRLEETAHLLKRQGMSYLRKGKKAIWHNEDLQSFSPLRKMVPQLMGFKGRALVVDPDVFAVGDVYDLLTRDMGGKAILCRNVSDGYKGNGHPFYASSVMLLDCTRLQHWRWDEDIDRMFNGELDYGPWIGLKHENPDIIEEIGEEWNSFDKLISETKLLHTTERLTQPWKTGLPIDFDQNVNTTPSSKNSGTQSPTAIFARFFRTFFNQKSSESVSTVRHYQAHPDQKQEKFFFELLRGAIDEGYIDMEMIQQRMVANDVRHDAIELLISMGFNG